MEEWSMVHGLPARLNDDDDDDDDDDDERMCFNVA